MLVRVEHRDPPTLVLGMEIGSRSVEDAGQAP